MSLNSKEVQILNDAIQNYGFPTVYFDFTKDMKVDTSSMSSVERKINDQLTSDNPQEVIFGLANVLYWGYAQIGYRNIRVKKFLNGTSTDHAIAFQNLLSTGSLPTLRQIRDLRMPEFSGISFISKILAFLDPVNCCVLDQQLARLANGDGQGALNKLTRGQQITVTVNNELAYKGWRNECQAISKKYFKGEYRAIDIERGFFQLVQSNQLPLAQAIYTKVVSC